MLNGILLTAMYVIGYAIAFGCVMSGKKEYESGSFIQSALSFGLGFNLIVNITMLQVQQLFM